MEGIACHILRGLFSRRGLCPSKFPVVLIFPLAAVHAHFFLSKEKAVIITE